MSSVWWIFLFTLFCIALFVCIALVWWSQKKIGLPRGGPFGRIAQWAEGVRQSEAEVKTATVGDLVLFVTLYVIGVTFVVTLYIGINSGSEEHSRQQIDDLTRQNQGQLQQLKADDEELAEFRQRIDRPEQVFPEADEEIIGPHVGFRWEYGNHNDASRYVLQLVRVDTGHETEATTDSGDVVHQLPFGKLCTFDATDAADQRSQIPTQEAEARGGELAPGTYMWRVAFGNLASIDSSECPQDEQVRYWSSFRKFTFFSSRSQRIRATDEIIVGTQFTQGAPFSRLGEEGRPSGFDMDLVRVLVEGCLRNLDGTVRFDEPSCRIAVAEECDRIQKGRNGSASASSPTNPCNPSGAVTVAADAGQSTPAPAPGKDIHMRLLPLPPELGLRSALLALQKRDLDLYIGSITKAAQREMADVVFSDEYLAYETEFLVDQNETCNTLACLARNGRKLGVVENTSNAWLATELHKQKELVDLAIVPVASFALLENAFEKQDVTAVIVDGTMAPAMGLVSFKSLNNDLKKQSGWRAYLRDFIGHDEKEGFAIATVDDIPEIRDDAQKTEEKDSEGKPPQNRGPEVELKRKNLLTELNKALDSPDIAMLINVLYHKYELDKWNAARLKTSGTAGRNKLQAMMPVFRQN